MFRNLTFFYNYIQVVPQEQLKLLIKERLKVRSRLGMNLQRHVCQRPETIHLISERISLPKLDLPEFSGGYDDYLGFQSTFAALI